MTSATDDAAASPTGHRADIRFVLIVAAAVVVVGMSVAAALLLVTGGAESEDCGLLRAGLTNGIRTNLHDGGAYALTRGSGCSFILDQTDGDAAAGGIVAYRVEVPGRDCSVRWQGSRGRYVCGGAEIAPDQIGRWPTWTTFESGAEFLMVDLTPDDPCDAYRLGDPESVAERIDEAPALIEVPACDAAFWIALDSGGAVATIAARGPDGCTVQRADDGSVRCGDAPVGPDDLPGPPVRKFDTDEGEVLAVDLTP